MRSRVETRRFEVLTRIFQHREGPGRRRRVRAQRAIDVVDAKADSFHMEGGDRPGERVALLDDGRGARVARRAQQGGKFRHACARLFPMIEMRGGHDPTAYCSGPLR